MKLFFTTLLLGLTGVWIFNYFQDVSGFNQIALVSSLTQEQGPSDTLVSNAELDQRVWLKARLESREGCPDVLVMGSSTLGLVNEKMAGNNRFLNAWLSQPTMEDFEAILGILKKTQCRPKHVMIGADHWMFNSAYDFERWTSIREDFIEYVKGGGKAFDLVYLKSYLQFIKSYWARFAERLSYTTTRAAIRAALNKRNEGAQSTLYLSKESTEKLCLMKQSTASFRRYSGANFYCAEWTSSQSEVDEAGKNYLVNNLHEIKHWRRIDASRLERFKRVIHDLNLNGATVLIVSSPFHPLTYAKLMENEDIAGLFKKLDKELAALEGFGKVSYLNFRNPSLLECHNSDFIDSHHAKSDCITRVVTETMRGK